MDDNNRIGRKFHQYFLPYRPIAEITNVMIEQMAKEYSNLQVRCKAFDDALADLEDRYAEEIYPPPDWDEDALTLRDRDLVRRIKGQTVRLACEKLRKTSEELCKANGVLKN